MLEKRNMTIDDYVKLAEQNSDIYPDFAKLPEEKKRLIASCHIEGGTSVCYYRDGKLVAGGGILCTGLGLAWLFVRPGLRQEKELLVSAERQEEIVDLMDGVKSALEEIETVGVRVVYAENKLSETFLTRLGFKKKTIFVRTETV